MSDPHSDFVIAIWGISAFMLAFLIGWKVIEWGFRLRDWLRWRQWRKHHVSSLEEIWLEKQFIATLQKHLRVVPLGRLNADK